MTKTKLKHGFDAKKVWQSLLKNQYSDVLLLVILAMTVIILNFIWRSIEVRPPHWDMGRHLFNSVVYFDFAKSSELRNLIADYRYYPPFLYWVAIPYYLLFGLSIKTAILSNSFFIFVMAFSVYGIGCRLWGRRTGLLVAIFILCSPMIVTQFKEFQLDAPATAMVALCLYLLIRTKEFESRWWSLAFGIALGFTMLTKWTLVFVLALPTAYAVAIAFAADIKNKNTNRIFNILVSSLAAFFIMSFWYLQNIGQIAGDLISNGGDAGAREGDPAVGTFASNIWYAKNLINNQLYLVPFTLFISGIIYSFKNARKYFRQNIYPWLLIFGTLAFFTILRNKDARYTLPLLVGVSIISTYWIAQIKSSRIKNLTTILLVAYSFFAFFTISFGVNILPNTNHLGGITIFDQKGYLIGSPTGENWHQEEIFKDISSQAGGKTLYIGFIPDEMYFNNWGSQYYALVNNITITDNLLNANYVVVKKGLRNVSWPSSVVVKEYSLPNGSKLELIKRTEQ